MALSVSSLSRVKTSPKLETASFRDVMEDHLTILRGSTTNNAIAIYPTDKYKWQGDFFGLLKEKNISEELHWITMRMAGLSDPLLFDEAFVGDVLLVPSASTINTLAARHDATLRI